MIETQPGSAASPLRVMPTASGHNVLLAGADYGLYHLHITRFFTHHRPEGQRESELVQRLADTEWRINRIARLEMALYAHGQVEFAHLFAIEDPNVASLLLEAHTLKVYGRQVKELALQESRLRRYFDKDAAALADLQRDRQSQEQEGHPPAIGISQPVQAVHAAPAPAQRPNGFEFSSAPSQQTTTINPAGSAHRTATLTGPEPSVSSSPS